MTTGAPGSLVGDKAAAPVVVIDPAERAGAPNPNPNPNPSLEGADLSNVILFRPRGTAGGEPETAAAPIDTRERPAPWVAAVRHPVWTAALILGSALVHASLLLLFMQPPKPLASLGVESISVEIVLGTSTPMGEATMPDQNEAQKTDNKSNQVTDAPTEREQATAQPQQVPVAQQDQAAAPSEQSPTTTASVEPDPPPPEPQAQPEPPPAVTAAPDPEPKPDVAASVPEPRPLPPPKPVVPRRDDKPAKPVQAQTEKESPVKKRGEHNTRIAARTADTPANERTSPAASGRGVGRSDADSNYPGQVFAHLARYKQLPANALKTGEQAKPTVAFGLDGGGRVTSVRLARGSGNSSIDQAVQAMVRRASPFPAPPSGHAKNFSITVTFRLPN